MSYATFLAADIYKRIKYHYLHFPDEESATFEKAEIKIIKNSNPFLVFSHRKHFLLLYTGAREYHCSISHEVINKNRTQIIQYRLPWANMQKVFYKTRNASYEKTNTSYFKLMALSKVLSDLFFTPQNEDLKRFKKSKAEHV